MHKITYEGGRNHGLYKKLREQSNSQLLRSARSYGANIAEHQKKIGNPAKYVENWEAKSEAYKSGLIAKWEKDIQRNQEQLNIAVGVAKERGLRYE